MAVQKFSGLEYSWIWRKITFSIDLIWGCLKTGLNWLPATHSSPFDPLINHHVSICFPISKYHPQIKHSELEDSPLMSFPDFPATKAIRMFRFSNVFLGLFQDFPGSPCLTTRGWARWGDEDIPDPYWWIYEWSSLGETVDHWQIIWYDQIYIYIYYMHIYIHILHIHIYKWDTDIVVIHIAPKLRMKMDRPPILNLGFGPSGDGGWTSSSSATVLTYTILHYFLDISGQSNMVKFWVFWRMCHCHAEIVMYVKVSLEGKL
jgi:hypothetical protein